VIISKFAARVDPSCRANFSTGSADMTPVVACAMSWLPLGVSRGRLQRGLREEVVQAHIE
jgi:hypothetical protein